MVRVADVVLHSMCQQYLCSTGRKIENSFTTSKCGFLQIHPLEVVLQHLLLGKCHPQSSRSPWRWHTLMPFHAPVHCGTCCLPPRALAVLTCSGGMSSRNASRSTSLLYFRRSVHVETCWAGELSRIKSRIAQIQKHTASISMT